MGIRDTKYFGWEKLATIPDYAVLGGHVYVDYSSSIYLAYVSNGTCSLARSRDGGKNFTTIDQVSNYYTSAIPLFVFRSAINSNYLYYGGYVRNGSGGPGVQTAGWVRKSSDNGSTWITDLFSSRRSGPDSVWI